MLPIINVEHLGKRYRIGSRQPYHTLRESLMLTMTAPARWAKSLLAGRGARAVRGEYVLALDDVSFAVQPGDVLGIVGRNGAGKSTLLKILSRITEPSTGRAELYGRVGSLLEIGTGFHQELSGRDNVYLSGAILGMRRTEIARKFDEIVGFAEIERFIDTPVKHYSSGMYVRLAFAVAAHLEPEILLVDEVLAVGDVAFQKRCLGKMGDVAKQGRTVLFVSHNMSSIEALCNSCLYMQCGRLEGKGNPAEMISRYLANDSRRGGGSCSLINHPGRSSRRLQVMTHVELETDTGSEVTSIRMGCLLKVKVKFRSSGQPLHPVLAVVVKTENQAPVFAVSNRYITRFLFPQKVSEGTVTCTLDHLPLMPGTYYLDLSFGNEVVFDLDVVQEAISFEVTPADVFGSGKLPPATAGPIFWPAAFELDA
jgi:lipopolysaccharide transport system ATP-binding protein